MKKFKDTINENYENEFKKLYSDILRDIIDVNKNSAVMYTSGILHVVPKSAEKGDTKSGPKLAEVLLPKIEKALKGTNYKVEVIKVSQGPVHKRKKKPIYGGLKFS